MTVDAQYCAVEYVIAAVMPLRAWLSTIASQAASGLLALLDADTPLIVAAVAPMFPSVKLPYFVFTVPQRMMRSAPAVLKDGDV
jgi:hypothetical protein